MVRVEKVGGKSTVTKCFSKYPVNFIVPRKAGLSKVDSVWIYILSYGGGIVSGRETLSHVRFIFERAASLS